MQTTLDTQASIYVEKRNVYGNEMMYVISDHKKFISGLTHKKTVDSSDLEMLRGLGFSIIINN